MTINILMPALSPTMTEGTLLKWHVKEGDEIGSGDILAEIETDKATMEVEADEEGRIGKLLVAEGAEGVAVNAPIAVLLEEGEDESAIAAAPAPAPATAPAAATPAPAAPSAAPVPTAAPKSGERNLASPLAKRMARQAGLDLAAIRGSGPHGRVIKRDIEAALAAGAPAAAAAPGPAPAPAPTPAAAAGPSAAQLADLLGMAYELQPLSSMRKTIARRLTEAKQTVPHFYLTVDCEIDELLKVRKELNGRFEDSKISVNDFVIRAAALALEQVPGANASFDASGILLYEHADVSVAVTTPGGLITPIIRKAADDQGPGRDLGRDEAISPGAPARASSSAERIPGRADLHGFEPRHVRHQGIRRGDQPAAVAASWRSECRRAAPGGQGRRARHRHGDELYALGRPPGSVDGAARRAVPCRLQGS